LIGCFHFISFSLQQQANTQQLTTHNVDDIVISPPCNNQSTIKTFFSVSFQSSIAIGSNLSFDVDCGKRWADCILKARKAAADDHKVQMHLFLPFDQWELQNRYYPIGKGISQGLHEVILTTEISEFLFDRDVKEVAFVFTPEQLEECGAVLQGIDNALVFCFNQKGLKKVMAKTLLPVFPSTHDDLLCPVTQCYMLKVFHDLEYLRTPIYSDWNQVSKLQGDVNHTFNFIPFSSKSWDLFSTKVVWWHGAYAPSLWRAD
jgi:hypothetical protein